MAFTAEEVCNLALQLAGRGDKTTNDELNQALQIMQVILAEWAASMDVHLWNIAKNTEDVPIGDRVLGSDGSAVYQCIRGHTSATDNQPISGDLYNDYWVGTTLTSSPLTWASDITYNNNRIITLDTEGLEDVLSLQVLHNGQKSTVEKISLLEFKDLDEAELGLPTKCWVQRLETALELHLWPLCDKEDATLYYYSVNRPLISTGDQVVNIPDQWTQALYYALAVELGFVYNIGIDRLRVLGAKSNSAFNRAFRTNESEVDTCFVEPIY